MEGMESKKHYVLVHGAGHGAWCWYKLATLLRGAGKQVTAMDLTACGIRAESISTVATFSDYSRPLMEMMESLGDDERVILVGHSFGGINLALAMEKFPEKISVAVFVAAFMPDASSAPSELLAKHRERLVTLDFYEDFRWNFDHGPNEPPVSFSLGPKCLASGFYQNCPAEDVTLATTLVRPAPLRVGDLEDTNMLCKERYGSVNRVYVVCTEDKIIEEYFQHWMIENYPPNEVKEIKGSDHMAMLSKPHEVFQCLMEIGKGYT